MINEFQKFRGFMIFEYFLKYPSINININELSRKLKVSTGTVKYYCDILEADGILNSKRIGLARFFSLNNKDTVVKQIKKTYILIALKNAGIEKITKNPIYVFGSAVRGEYTEESDIDIFIINISDDIDEKVKEKIEKTIEKELKIIKVKYTELDNFKKTKRELFDEIKKEGVLFGVSEYGL